MYKIGNNTYLIHGYQTKEEREQTRQNVPVKQYLNAENPLIKPIANTIQQGNNFIKPVSEFVTPLLKREDKQQVDLFGHTFATKEKNTPINDTKYIGEDVIKHQLVEEEKEEALTEIEEPTALKFDVKISESEFATPLFVPAAPVAETPELVDVDAHKNDESMEEQLRKSKERILRLKDLSMKLRTSNGLQEMENEPAYKRKQMLMDNVPHSSESVVSRFTLSLEDGQAEIRPNNSFLHDNVD